MRCMFCVSNIAFFIVAVKPFNTLLHTFFQHIVCLATGRVLKKNSHAYEIQYFAHKNRKLLLTRDLIPL